MKPNHSRTRRAAGAHGCALAHEKAGLLPHVAGEDTLLGCGARSPKHPSEKGDNGLHMQRLERTPKAGKRVFLLRILNGKIRDFLTEITQVR